MLCSQLNWSACARARSPIARPPPFHTSRIFDAIAAESSDRAKPAGFVAHPVEHCSGRDADDGKAGGLRLDDRNPERLVGHRRDIDVRASQPAGQLGPVPQIARHDDAAVAERSDFVTHRSLANQSEPCAEAGGEFAERVGHHLRLLLAVEPPDIDQQRLPVFEAKLGPQLPVAPLGRELSHFHAQGNDVDIVDAQRPQPGRAAMFAQRIDRVEPPVERAAIGIADARAQAADGPTQEFGEGPLDVDRREVGHIRSDERGVGKALAVSDRGPRQIIGVLALDQVGRELRERSTDGAVAHHQPVMRASRDMRRCDRHRDRAALDDRFVARAGNNHQMAVRR